MSCLPIAPAPGDGILHEAKKPVPFSSFPATLRFGRYAVSDKTSSIHACCCPRKSVSSAFGIANLHPVVSLSVRQFQTPALHRKPFPACLRRSRRDGSLRNRPVSRHTAQLGRLLPYPLRHFILPDSQQTVKCNQPRGVAPGLSSVPRPRFCIKRAVSDDHFRPFEGSSLHAMFSLCFFFPFAADNQQDHAYQKSQRAQRSGRLDDLPRKIA